MTKQKLRQDIWPELEMRMEEGNHSYASVLKELGLPEKYKAYVSVFKQDAEGTARRGVTREVQEDFASALGLEPSLVRRYFRPALAKQWKPALEALGMSVEEVLASYIYKHRPDLWYLVPGEDEK